MHGETVIPADLEAVLAHEAGVGQVAVAAVRDHRGTTRIGAVVATGPGTDLGPWRRHARTLLSPALRPRLIVRADDVPLLPNGKIDRVRVGRLLEHPPSGESAGDLEGGHAPTRF